MDKVKNIALVAHDNRKRDLIEWVEWNYEITVRAIGEDGQVTGSGKLAKRCCSDW